MRPISLELSGFKGIRSAFGVETKRFYFGDLPYGLIAIAGDNGSAKSTMMGNLTPYRIMPNEVKTYSPHAFSFYDYTYGRNAKKDLVFECSGRMYRSLLQIDAERRRQEAYLYAMNIEGSWEIVESTQEGKVEAYDQAIEELLGSPQMFFTSVFRSQDAKKLSAYTQGEMRDIFAELLSIDHYKEMESNANYIEDRLIEKRDLLAADLKRLHGLIGKEKDTAKERKAVQKKIDRLTSEIAQCEKEIASAEERKRDIEITLSLQAEAVKRQMKVEAEIQEKEKRIAGVEASLKEKQEFYRIKLLAVKQHEVEAKKLSTRISELRELARVGKEKSAELESLKEQLDRCTQHSIELSSEMVVLSEIKAAMQKIEKDLLSIRLKQGYVAASIQKDIWAAEDEARKLEGIPCSDMDTCSGCPFIQSARALTKKLPALEEELRDAEIQSPKERELQAELGALREKTSHEQKLVNQRNDALAQKEAFSMKIQALESELSSLQGHLRGLPFLEEAQRAAVQSVSERDMLLREKEITEREIAAQGEALEKERQALLHAREASSASNEGLAEKQQLQDTIDAFKKSIQEKRAEEAETRIQIGSLIEIIKQIDKAKDQAKIFQEQIDFLNDEISEWKWVGTAVDGIRTLEIDDAGPSVSDIVNELLHRSFGPRFTIQICTQGLMRNGDLKDTFDIIVYDSERNETKPLKYMSGGEKTWIEEACTRGICLYNIGKSGKQYGALFTDEKDGALADKRKVQYMHMKRKVLQISGCKQEFFISHSPIAQQMADAVFEMR